jgi:hypothetical protein
MSLVNDALKRAKQAQKAGPATRPGDDLQLRPVEKHQTRRSHSVTGLIGAGIAVAAFVIVLLVWNSPQPSEPAAQAPAPAPAVPAPAPAVTPPASTPAATAPLIAATPPASAVPSTPEPAPANAAATTPPPPASPRLQGIFFDPKHPSAIVSGKTVSVGSRSGEYLVAAIDPGSVTLVSATATNVLTLE